MSTLTLQIDRGVRALPINERILLKAIKNRDDLDQLYCVIRASVAEGNEITVEVWENINREAAHAAQTT